MHCKYERVIEVNAHMHAYMSVCKMRRVENEADRGSEMGSMSVYSCIVRLMVRL